MVFRSTEGGRTAGAKAWCGFRHRSRRTAASARRAGLRHQLDALWEGSQDPHAAAYPTAAHERAGGSHPRAMRSYRSSFAVSSHRSVVWFRAATHGTGTVRLVPTPPGMMGPGWMFQRSPRNVRETADRGGTSKCQKAVGGADRAWTSAARMIAGSVMASASPVPGGTLLSQLAVRRAELAYRLASVWRGIRVCKPGAVPVGVVRRDFADCAPTPGAVVEVGAVPVRAWRSGRERRRSARSGSTVPGWPASGSAAPTRRASCRPCSLRRPSPKTVFLGRVPGCRAHECQADRHRLTSFLARRDAGWFETFGNRGAAESAMEFVSCKGSCTTAW